MKIKYVETIEGSPVVPFVARAWVRLMAENLWDRNSVLISGELSCVYAVEGRKIIGCLTWHGEPETGWTINLGYVVSSHRRQGIYSKLHEAMLVKAREFGVKQITSIVKPTNEPIRASKDKHGYKLHSLYYILKVADESRNKSKAHQL